MGVLEWDSHHFNYNFPINLLLHLVMPFHKNNFLKKNINCVIVEARALSTWLYGSFFNSDLDWFVPSFETVMYKESAHSTRIFFCFNIALELCFNIKRFECVSKLYSTTLKASRIFVKEQAELKKFVYYRSLILLTLEFINIHFHYFCK